MSFETRRCQSHVLAGTNERDDLVRRPVPARLKKYRRISIRLTTQRRVGAGRNSGDLVDGHRSPSHAQKIFPFEKQSTNQILLSISARQNVVRFTRVFTFSPDAYAD